MKDQNKVLSFNNDFNSIDKEIDNIGNNISNILEKAAETTDLCEELKKELLSIPGGLIIHDGENDDKISNSVLELNDTINEVVNVKNKSNYDLSSVDVLISILSGVVASIIDIVFVGTPEVVKIYKGGENFDGSILTKALRKAGNNDSKLSDMLHWLSKGCQTPYDISTKKNVVYPNNHRLRSFGHDPLLGVLFAIVDIILGTATVIDNNGNLRILINDKDFPKSEKFLSLIYYLGHLISDVCTSRGLPIPGFVLTQFFQNGNDDDNSLAKICENMYVDGYDMRHLASMSVPVVVKNLIIDIYIKIFRNKELKEIQNIAQHEIYQNSKDIFKYKLILISDVVSCSGNALKFFIPPTSGNITALNLPEWSSLIRNGIINTKYILRNKSVETVLNNREEINNNWYSLLD